MVVTKDLPSDPSTTTGSQRVWPAVPPPSFWDKLSKVHLTENALQELDRRNAEQIHKARRQRSQRRAQTGNPVSVNRSLSQCSPTLLGKVKLYARRGGPDLTDLIGYCTPHTESKMSSVQSSIGRRNRGSQSLFKNPNTTPTNTTIPTTSKKTGTTKNTGPYDRNFGQHLIDNNIFPNRYKYPDGSIPPRPSNLEEIREVFRQRRPSLSPSLFSDDKFEAFDRADAHAVRERDVTADVIPMIEGDFPDRRCIGRQVSFTNLDSLIDGLTVPGSSDLYYGARPEQLNLGVRGDLEGHIIPSTHSDLPILPNFFLEVKGPDGTLSVASRQACYIGALGARAMQSLQSHGSAELQFDNKAYTLTSIYYGGMLTIYATHPIPSRSGANPGYVLTQVNAWALTGSPDSFRQGLAGYRNARDWAKQQRDEAIKQANERLATHM